MDAEIIKMNDEKKIKREIDLFCDYEFGDKNKEGICPYRSKDTIHIHVFNYGGSGLYCDNIECLNLDQSKAFFVEGEGMPVWVCKANGVVDEKSELVKKIKESEFFKTLESEKLEESRKNHEEAIRDELYSD